MRDNACVSSLFLQVNVVFKVLIYFSQMESNQMK